MKARSIRFRGRTIVVGRTAFIFDKEGICVHLPKGNSLSDFKALLRYPGVDSLEPPASFDEDPTVPLAPAPPPSRLKPEEKTPVVVMKHPVEPPPDKVCACGTKMWGGSDLPDLCPDCQLKALVPEQVTAEVEAFQEPGLEVTSTELEAVPGEEPTVEQATDAELPAPAPASKGRRRRTQKVQEG